MEEYDLALNVSQINSEAPNNKLQDDMLVLQNLRVSYPNSMIIYHLNIKSICNEFKMLSLKVAQYVNILILSETNTMFTLYRIGFHAGMKIISES